MRKLKLNERLNNPPREVLQTYLDKGYILKLTNNHGSTAYKDMTEGYPYRFQHAGCDNSERLVGCWTNYDWIIAKVPTNISFKKIIQCN